MQTTRLGLTELKVSVLGLGTVELGMPYGLGRVAPPDDKDCIRLLQRAVDHGVSYIDTAAAYGRSEELIGRAFVSSRPRPVIATKVTLRDADGTPWMGRRIGEEIRASIDRSRRLLGVDRLDLVQIHNADTTSSASGPATAASTFASSSAASAVPTRVT
jgi:aryl-alcohol dehydrogenase-like predicted oxidoreductase